MLREVIQDITTNGKFGAGVAAANAGTGLGTILNLIPDDIGKLSVVFSMVVGIVVIYTSLKRIQHINVKIKLDQMTLDNLKKEANTKS